MQYDDDISGRYGCLKVALLAASAAPGDSDIKRIHLDDTEPVKVDILTTSWQRFGIVAGDQVISLSYLPPKSPPPKEPEPLQPAYLRAGMR